MSATQTEVKPFKRRVYIGAIDTGHRSRALVHVDMTWTGERLSLQADAARPMARDIDQGGQMQETIAAMTVTDLAPEVNSIARDRLVELWDRWHLNDMRAA